MRIGSRFAYLCIIVIFLMIAVAITPIDAQADFTYWFGYVVTDSSINYDLHLISPDGVTVNSHSLSNIIPVEHRLEKTQSSPNGEWVYFSIYDPNDASYYLRILNVITGDFEDIVSNSIFTEIVWSWDSGYLAIIADDYLADSSMYADYFVYLYEPITNTLSTMRTLSLNSFPRELSWSMDSNKLAFTVQACPELRCENQITLEIFDVTTLAMVNSIVFNSAGNRICDLEWSPNGERISFVFSCGTGLELALAEYINDIYLWEISTSTIRPLTNFTQSTIPINEIDYSTIIRAGHQVHWIDADTLIISHFFSSFEYGVGYDEATFDYGTSLYNIDGSNQMLSEEYLFNITMNPDSAENIYYTQTYNLEARDDGMIFPVMENTGINIATFDNTTLVTQFEFDSDSIRGICDFMWSPDGMFVAIQSGICRVYLESLNILNVQNRTQVNQPVPQDAVAMGWLIVE